MCQLLAHGSRDLSQAETKKGCDYKLNKLAFFTQNCQVEKNCHFE